MKRLLIISYYWPPTGGSGVQRWVKFAKYLPSEGWQPVIYTPENPEQLATDESLLKDIPACAEVIKTRIFEPYGVYRKLMGGGKKGAQGEVNPVNSDSKGLLKRLSLWVRGNLFIPDPRISWVRPSIKFLVKYLKEHPVDAIVTTGPPHSMHLIGLGLKRRLGVKWIADFRDPWTQMFYYKHLKLSAWADRRHHRLEKQVLSEADLVIAVSPPVRDDFAAQTSTPVKLLTNGFDPDDFPASSSCQKSQDEFRIVHTGLFAAAGNPLGLWDVLAKMTRKSSDFRSRLRIRLAGKTDPQILEAIRARGLGDNLVDLGYITHERAAEEQALADILILPLRHEAEYAKVLPGKIFEYMASGSPVLGIGQEDGAAARLLSESGAGLMFDWDRTEQMEAFVKNPRRQSENIEKYTRRHLTHKLVELL